MSKDEARPVRKPVAFRLMAEVTDSEQDHLFAALKMMARLFSGRLEMEYDREVEQAAEPKQACPPQAPAHELGKYGRAMWARHIKSLTKREIMPDNFELFYALCMAWQRHMAFQASDAPRVVTLASGYTQESAEQRVSNQALSDVIRLSKLLGIANGRHPSPRDRQPFAQVRECDSTHPSSHPQVTQDASPNSQ